MKINVTVTLSKPKAIECHYTDVTTINIPVDVADIEDNETDIWSWIAYKLEEIYNKPFFYKDFSVDNIVELIEEIKFDKFKAKTTV